VTARPQKPQFEECCNDLLEIGSKPRHSASTKKGGFCHLFWYLAKRKDRTLQGSGIGSEAKMKEQLSFSPSEPIPRILMRHPSATATDEKEWAMRFRARRRNLLVARLALGTFVPPRVPQTHVPFLFCRLI